MNNIIAEKNKKRYLPHDVNTRKYAVEMYRNCGDIEYVDLGQVFRHIFSRIFIEFSSFAWGVVINIREIL